MASRLDGAIDRRWLEAPTRDLGGAATTGRVRRRRARGARAFVKGSAVSVLERADALAAFTEIPGEITRPYGTRRHSSERSPRSTGGPGTRACPTRRDAADPRSGARRAAELPTLAASDPTSTPSGTPAATTGRSASWSRSPRSSGSATRSLPYAIEMVAFADEEGLRFQASYLAQPRVRGLLRRRGRSRIVSDDGTRLADAIRAMGGDPGRPRRRLRRTRRRCSGYLEVHIEQGPVLQAEDLPVGIVTAIAGAEPRLRRLVGEAGHAGNTPPHLRRDALAGAAELVLAVERSMREEPGLIATVGKAEIAAERRQRDPRARGPELRRPAPGRRGT